MPSGIDAYAAYLPLHLLATNSLDADPAGGSSRGARSVASYDEDSVTMAVESLRSLVDVVRPGVPLFLATTSAPYEVKTCASIAHEAVGLGDDVAAVDLRGNRSGATALDLAARTGGVVAVSDVRTTRAGAPDELAQGDAAAAFVGGEGTAATLVGRGSATGELLERWRLPGEGHDRVWDERFTADVLMEFATTAVRRALTEAGVAGADHIVVSSSNARAAAAIRRALQGSGADAEIERQTGFTGTAHPGLLLADALDRAKPGERILLVSAAEGADAFVFEVGDGIGSARRGPSVRDQLARRVAVGYGRYLRWRGLLDVQGPARPASAAPASPPMHRRVAWKYRLEGSQCDACGHVTTPPSPMCAACGVAIQADSGGKVSLRDRVARVVSATQDHLTTMPEDEVAMVVANVDGGGRLTAYATDVDPDDVVVGMAMLPTFRRLWTTDGIHNYFWKLRPWKESADVQ